MSQVYRLTPMLPAVVKTCVYALTPILCTFNGDFSSWFSVMTELKVELSSLQGRPPPVDAQRSLQQEEEDPRSQLSLDGARAFLQGMSRTQTASYYDSSLLENPRDIPLRNVAPNEYRHVNPLLPNGDENPLTRGHYLGQNRGRTVTGNQGTYNPNTGGCIYKLGLVGLIDQ